jgi:peptide deformylase
MIVTDEDTLLIPSTPVLPGEAAELLTRLENELRMSEVQGIGLAACQIGVVKQAFIIRISAKHSYNFINARITHLSEPLIFTAEGCLSYPGQSIRTLRYNTAVIVDDLNPQGIRLTGLPAIVAQHEHQHTIGQSMFRNQLSNIKDDGLCLCSSNLTFAKCCKAELRKHMRIF